MNILFLLKSFSTGGVEVVSQVLANEFIKHGHNVSFFIMRIEKYDVLDKLETGIKVFKTESYGLTTNNIKCLRKVLIDNSIQVIINQWGLPFIPVVLARMTSKNLNIKIISIHHNSPDANGRLQKIKDIHIKSQFRIGKIISDLRYKIMEILTSTSMRYVYNNSDLYMVLSPSFVEKFKSFTGIKNPARLVVQTNPVTVDASGYVYSKKNKIKEIIYVGRIDYNQKRVYRVIDTWALLEDRFPDWRLTIVGDGPDRMNIEKKVQETGLQRVSFEGFQRPEKYYERASLLVLTSEYEGFPLVLAECMSYGVVPVVYGSYSAVYDIVKSGENGVVVEPDSGKFIKYKMVGALSCLMQDAELMNMMAINAIATSKDYSLDTVYDSWNRIFSKLIKD